MVDMKKIVALFLAIFCFLTLPSISVKAEELRDVMGCHTGENSITVYLKNQEKEIDHIISVTRNAQIMKQGSRELYIPWQLLTILFPYRRSTGKL